MNVELPPYVRGEAGDGAVASRIGGGAMGGKATGLVAAREVLARGDFGEVDADVPRFAVLCADVFDTFMAGLDVEAIVAPGATDERIAHAFQKHDFPIEHVGDLRALVERTHTPIAVRSSSMLEDALAHPFAGVYETKMIPNDQPDSDTRFQKLVEAIKFVYASMFFRGARAYLQAIGKTARDEKMAVVLQDVVGMRHGDRYYPHVSGVGRTYNYYAFGRARPQDGVVSLALGLGKTIVDGGVAWSYSPAYPKIPPPVGSVAELLKTTQTTFWAVNMGAPPAFDPVSEIEYMEARPLADADYDGVLDWVASTVDHNGRLVPGARGDGVRVVNFAPLLEYDAFPLNPLVRALLEAFEKAMGADVEIEFALDLPTRTAPRARLGFLQVRPMAGPRDTVDIPAEPPAGLAVLLGSERAMGNGVVDTIEDIVYVRPDAFALEHSRTAANDLEAVNRALLGEGRRYLLIGFGRWGSADPWLGIPVSWPQICAAGAIVEACIPGVRVDPSQGSHFFHNLSSFGVSYFTVRSEGAIDWAWLQRIAPRAETALVRHLRLETPLHILVDGRSGRGVVYRPSRGEG
ncbi:MAG: PEP/pyruvate-binding domain-containing protein [Candidatus Krumholzibacteria bacterium]|nr:PEP/pyruvate-binding domain-containing protein [Candidatus Krumholzibacteria bacterium]